MLLVIQLSGVLKTFVLFEGSTRASPTSADSKDSWLLDIVTDPSTVHQLEGKPFDNAHAIIKVAFQISATSDGQRLVEITG